MRILHVINHVGIRSGAAKVMMDLLLYQKSKGHIVDVVALFKMDLSYDMKEFGCDIRILFDSKNELYRYNPLAIIKLVPILSKYDIIHVHLFPSLYWVALANVISFSKSKLVYTEHCSVNNRQNIKILIPLEKFIYKQYDKIISISDSVDYYLKKTIGNCGIIEKIYNGINRELFIKSNPKLS